MSLDGIDYVLERTLHCSDTMVCTYRNAYGHEIERSFDQGDDPPEVLMQEPMSLADASTALMAGEDEFMFRYVDSSSSEWVMEDIEIDCIFGNRADHIIIDEHGIAPDAFVETGFVDFKTIKGSVCPRKDWTHLPLPVTTVEQAAENFRTAADIWNKQKIDLDPPFWNPSDAIKTDFADLERRMLGIDWGPEPATFAADSVVTSFDIFDIEMMLETIDDYRAEEIACRDPQRVREMLGFASLMDGRPRVPGYSTEVVCDPLLGENEIELRPAGTTRRKYDPLTWYCIQDVEFEQRLRELAQAFDEFNEVIREYEYPRTIRGQLQRLGDNIVWGWTCFVDGLEQFGGKIRRFISRRF